MPMNVTSWANQTIMPMLTQRVEQTHFLLGSVSLCVFCASVTFIEKYRLFKELKQNPATTAGLTHGLGASTSVCYPTSITRNKSDKLMSNQDVDETQVCVLRPRETKYSIIFDVSQKLLWNKPHHIVWKHSDEVIQILATTICERMICVSFSRKRAKIWMKSWKNRT